MTAIHIDEFLKKIRSLSENIEINRDIPFEGELLKPGTVYVYEIYVVYGRNRFHITERVRMIFFQYFYRVIMKNNDSFYY